MNVVWSPFERSFVAASAHLFRDRELAGELYRLTGRLASLAAVRQLRQRLGVAKAPGRGRCQVVARRRPAAPPS